MPLVDVKYATVTDLWDAFVSFFQKSQEDDVIEFLNYTKFRDIVVTLRHPNAHLGLLHLSCFLGKVSMTPFIFELFFHYLFKTNILISKIAL